MSDRNQRQYRLMLERLAAFEEGRLPLDMLVIDLEGLLNALERVQASWRVIGVRVDFPQAQGIAGAFDIRVTVGQSVVTVRGIVIDGTARIGTARSG